MDTRCNTVRLHQASITVLILGVAGACFREDKHDARMRESMPIRYAHSANMHRHIGLVRSMSDLNLSRLTPVMATSKHAEDFTRQVGHMVEEGCSLHCLADDRPAGLDQAGLPT